MPTEPSGDRAPEALRPLRCYVDADWDAGTIQGWALVPDQALASVQIEINGEPAGSGPIEPFPDLARVYPWIPQAGRSGFRVAARPGLLRRDAVNRIAVIGCREGRPIARQQVSVFPDSLVHETPVPPPEFIEKTQGDHNAAYYRMLGFRYYNQFLDVIARHRDLSTVHRVLDWACGSGRVAANFLADPRGYEVHGIDIDEGAIAWCQANLSRGSFLADTGQGPPLPFGDGTFDLAIALGVFAAFGPEGQIEWVNELARTLAPGGLLLASVQGAFAASFLFPPVTLQELARTGALDGSRHQPPGRPKGATQGFFVTRDHVSREWTRHLEVVEHLEGEINADQDLVVLRRPA